MWPGRVLPDTKAGANFDDPVTPLHDNDPVALTGAAAPAGTISVPMASTVSADVAMNLRMMPLCVASMSRRPTTGFAASRTRFPLPFDGVSHSAERLKFAGTTSTKQACVVHSSSNEICIGCPDATRGSAEALPLASGVVGGVTRRRLVGSISRC